MTITKITFYHILVALAICSLTWICFISPVDQKRRFLSDSSSCGPVKDCPGGEEAYFRTYPDVAIKWKPRAAYHHWKRYGKAEGRHYICSCPKSEDRVLSAHEKDNDNGFVVVAIFKNEAMNFAEWISHYLWQGALHFYLVDNGSTDDWISTIPKEVHAQVTVTRDEASHIQRRSYSSLLPILQERHPKDWALIID